MVTRLLFTETNPDKGTKTKIEVRKIDLDTLFTETNPDKGTKTIRWSNGNLPMTIPFTETNPDKGTETHR